MVKYYLKSTGYPERLKSSLLYEFNMEDRQGKLRPVRALGIEEITDIPEQPGIRDLKDLFPQAPDEAFERPQGKVDILIGANYRELQPAGGLERDGCQKDGLRLSESKFGCGWVLSGTHARIRQEGELTTNAKLLANAVIVEDIEEIQHEELDVVSVHLTKQYSVPDFFAAEDLGVTPAPSCGRCMRCPDCSFLRLNLSKEEREVVDRQKQLLNLNKDTGILEAQYAFTEDVFKLKDNFGQGIAFQKSIEKKLLKSGDIDAYNAEIQKVLDKGHIAEMTEEDIEVQRYSDVLYLASPSLQGE